jgi:hypothetical protein
MTRRLRMLAFSAITGVVISSFYAIGQELPNAGWILFTGGLIGLLINLCVHLLSRLFAPMIKQLPQPYQVYAQALLFLIGGMSGWALGLFLWFAVTRRRITIEPFLHLGSHAFFMLITGIVAVMVGLIFRAFDVLGERLRQREWAERELEMARAIQARLLPPPTLSGPGFSLTARNLPARLVAGDFYDFVRLDDGSIVIVVADVAGKGMGASLIMASVKAVLPFVAREGVAAAMQQLNRKLVGELGKREFVALVCARFAPAARTIELANAGCPDPYLVRGGIAEALSVGGMRLPLGLRADAQYETRSIQLEEGDRLLFLTDGIPEAPSLRDEQLGYEEVARIVAATDGDAAWLDAFLANVRAHVREGLEDDWTAVALELT